MSDHDEFYVGYLPEAPAGIARRLRAIVLVLVVIVVVVAVVLVSRQSHFGRGVFEFGIEREFTGVVLERPYPTLVLSGYDSESAPAPTLLMSAFGKHGAEEFTRGLNGQPVRVRGSLVYRDGRAMVEVHELTALTPAESKNLTLPPDAGTDRGSVRIVGEVVDSKCFLGVMKPGHTKPHRGCAVRCISGGVPPVLLVVRPDGTALQYLLASANGEMINAEVLPYVAQRVEITGNVRSYGNLDVLYADPATYRRLP